MTSFCIASRSVSHSLIETGILWSLSLTKKPESMARNLASGPLPGHEDQPLEEVDVLFVLQQRSVKRRDDGLALLAPQRVGWDVFGEQQLQPIEQLGGGRLFLQTRYFAHF